MDDILIATTSVTENLKILEEVLIVLKKYKLKLNLAKCLFLKRKLNKDYLISANGITINKRHIRAISTYPRNLKQL